MTLREITITPQEALQRTIEHREIFHDEMIALMRQIMRGEVSPLMTAAIITGLRVKKETIGEIMGVRHKTLDVEGVQFHPESILSEHGHAVLRNFLQAAPRVAQAA